MAIHYISITRPSQHEPGKPAHAEFVVCDQPIDIIYWRTGEGWLYLCCVLDLFSREIVGWSMKERMSADIVQEALTMAKFRRHPKAGLIFHSDRGSQYASHAVRNCLANESFYNCDRWHSALGYQRGINSRQRW